MAIVINKRIPILKTREQLRKQDFLRDACKFVNSRMKLQKIVRAELNHVTRNP